MFQIQGVLKMTLMILKLIFQFKNLTLLKRTILRRGALCDCFQIFLSNPLQRVLFRVTFNFLMKIRVTLFFSINQIRVFHCLRNVRIWSFLACMFPHLAWIRRDTLNTGKCGPEKLQKRTLFRKCLCISATHIWWL